MSSHPRFIYILVVTSGLALDMLLFAILEVGMGSGISAFVSTLIAGVWNYALLTKLAFRSPYSLPSMLKFITVSVFVAGLGGVSVSLLTTIGITSMIAKVSAVLLVSALQYFLHKYWTYRS